MEWRREHDGYYPRDTYRDLMHYCGGRCSQQVEASSEYFKNSRNFIDTSTAGQHPRHQRGAARGQGRVPLLQGGRGPEGVRGGRCRQYVDVFTVVIRTLWCPGNILPQVPAVF